MKRVFVSCSSRSALVSALLAVTILSFNPTQAFAAKTFVNAAGDVEYTGKLNSELIPEAEGHEQTVFKPLRDTSKIKMEKPLDPTDKVTAGRLYSPLLDKSAILTLLVEPEGDTPYIYADLNLDNMLSENERFTLTRSDDNPHILSVTLKLPMKSALFDSYPIVIEYFKNVRWDNLQEGEQILLQSKTAYATGTVTIQDRPTLVQYAFNAKSKKISLTNGWLGIDSDGDGKVDMSRFSPEAAEAQDETIIFRIGTHYVSTKRVDLEKNQIVMREHPAAEYKRVELRVGSAMPDFKFTDFEGKKRQLSEFRGKYVLLDFWGMWCPACRDELPYLRTAYSRFQARNFEIIGMDTDEDPSSIKGVLKKNNLNWTQATKESIRNVIVGLRVHLFPSAILIGPDGNIVSLNQRGGELSLRDADLLKTLDHILPP